MVVQSRKYTELFFPLVLERAGLPFGKSRQDQFLKEDNCKSIVVIAVSPLQRAMKIGESSLLHGQSGVFFQSFIAFRE